MTKPGHIKRTIIITADLERRIIVYCRACQDTEEKKGISKRFRMDGSKLAEAAISEYLDAREHKVS